MILAVNIGNTTIRAAIGQNEPVSDVVFSSREVSLSEHFINLIERRFCADLWRKLEGSIVFSVVPNQTPIVADAIRNKIGKAPQRIDIQRCGDLNMRHYNGLPGEDRVVCCVSALQKYTPPFILIDFGTATTINVVSGHKEFLGGAILTGVQIGIKALSDNTAQLPRIDIGADVRVIGKSTEENLISGAVIGTACSIEGYIRRIRRELDCTTPVIVTGGHAPMVLPYCDFEYVNEPNLLLDGLFVLYKKNQEGF